MANSPTTIPDHSLPSTATAFQSQVTACHVISAARHAAALALELAESSDPSLRQLCYELANRCSAAATRIQRELLWAKCK